MILTQAITLFYQYITWQSQALSFIRQDLPSLAKDEKNKDWHSG